MSSGSRPAAVAGYFYPDDPATLAALVDRLLAEARVRARSASSPSALPATPKALVVPHAGYIYSGPIAA